MLMRSVRILLVWSLWMVVSEDLYLEKVGGFSIKFCKILYCVEFIRIIKNFLLYSWHKPSETCPEWSLWATTRLTTIKNESNPHQEIHPQLLAEILHQVSWNNFIQFWWNEILVFISNAWPAKVQTTLLSASLNLPPSPLHSLFLMLWWTGCAYPMWT